MHLLDTDTLIYFLNGDANVLENMARHESEPKAMSVVTLGELLYGAAKSSHPTRNAARVRRVAEILPVVELGVSVIETFAGLKAELEQQGQRLDDFDLLIAATALTLNYSLVTNNTKHFERIDGLRIANWSK